MPQCASLYPVCLCCQVNVDAAYVRFSEDFDDSGLRKLLVGLPGKTGPCLDVEMGMFPKEIVGKRVSTLTSDALFTLSKRAQQQCTSSTTVEE